MNDLLQLYFDKFVIIYLNDILIYFKNDEKYTQYIKLMIEAFRKHEFYAKSSKCNFYQKHIKFCEHIIDDGKIKMNETKFKIIKNWLSLQIVHDVRFFLKLYAYYKRFIKNFVLLTKFLYDLIKEAKNKKFKSMQMHFAARNAFTIIKNVMCNDKVLVQSNISLSFIIEIDVFDFDWKVVLYQADFDGVKRSVAFESKTFSLMKRNYVIHEREFLIIKKSLKKWRCYIENDIITVVRTNHAGLQHIKIIVKSFERLIKWLIEFEKYKLNIRYKFEIEMIVSNILSKRNDYKLRIFKINLRTINFNDVIIIYARDNILLDEIEWNILLKRFENQFKMNDEN